MFVTIKNTMLGFESNEFVWLSYGKENYGYCIEYHFQFLIFLFTAKKPIGIRGVVK